MGEELLNMQALKARGCGYLWDEAEAWGAWRKVIKNKENVR